MLADGYICTTNEPNTVNITNQSTAIFYQQKSRFILAFHCSFIKLSLLRQMTAIMWLMLFGKQILDLTCALLWSNDRTGAGSAI